MLSRISTGRIKRLTDMLVCGYTVSYRKPTLSLTLERATKDVVEMFSWLVTENEISQFIG